MSSSARVMQPLALALDGGRLEGRWTLGALATSNVLAGALGVLVVLAALGAWRTDLKVSCSRRRQR